MVDETQSKYSRIFIAFILYAVIFALLIVQSSFMNLASVAILYLIIIVIVCVLRNHESISLKWGPPTLIGVFFGSIMISAIFVVSMLAGWVQILEINSKSAIIFIEIIVLQILVSVGEEISFREFILRNCMFGMNKVHAIIISSLMFASIHFFSIMDQRMGIENNIIMFSTLFLNGILFALLYIKYGLYASMGFHFAWNILQYNVFALREGFNSLLELSYQGSIIFSGGQYGPEAGLIGILAMGLGIIAVILFNKKPDKT